MNHEPLPTYQISLSTLKRLAGSDQIRTIKLPKGKKRLFANNDIEEIFKVPELARNRQKKKICYARVSSEHQKEDLQRQIQFLQQHYPGYEIISDIGSGLNWKRKGFETLLENLYQGMVEELVVTYKDRLCRFGFELMEWLCQKSQCKIVVHNEPFHESQNQSSHQELADDLLSIITVFTARNNGLRAAQNRKQRKEEEEKEETQQEAEKR